MCTKEELDIQKKIIEELEKTNTLFDLDTYALLHSEIWLGNFSEYFKEKLEYHKEKNTEFKIVSLYNATYHRNFYIKSPTEITYDISKDLKLEGILITFDPRLKDEVRTKKNKKGATTIETPLNCESLLAADYDVLHNTMMLTIGSSNILLFNSIQYIDPQNTNTANARPVIKYKNS
ncbi:MAG: hypothetical protein ACP5NV_02645 [Candidatus Woesearchaeota archaeon]